jgi:hypothetical protein
LLLISAGTSKKAAEDSNLNRKPNKVYTAEELGVKAVTIPPKLASRSKDLLDVAIHQKQEENIVMENAIVSHENVTHITPTAAAKKAAAPTKKYASFDDDTDEITSIDVLLKKQHEIPTPKAIKTTDGKGWSNLIEQAGVNPNNLEEALSAMNLSMKMPMRPPPPLLVTPQQNLPPPPPLLPIPGHQQSDAPNNKQHQQAGNKDGPKVMINKQAANRIVKHELGKQQPATDAKPNKEDHHGQKAPEKQITAILKNAKKLPAGTTAPGNSLSAQAKDFVPPSESQPSSSTTATTTTAAPTGHIQKTAALTAILGRTKAQAEKKEHTTTSSSSSAAPPVAPVESHPPKEKSFAAAAGGGGDTTQAPKKTNINALLSNAKKQMQSKLQEDKKNSETAPAAPAAHVEKKNKSPKASDNKAKETAAHPPVPPSKKEEKGEKEKEVAKDNSDFPQPPPPPPPPVSWNDSNDDNDKDNATITTTAAAPQEQQQPEGGGSMKKVTHLFKQSLSK